ncbi:MAG TPA: uroporphyrinogen-III C-methyltransferase [bacterium]|nr:uroporphyrinogen-III C-methyltransferase [bacterium]
MRRSSSKKSLGLVSLVGAGPGDPGLLTLKAKERLESADIVFFDQLVHPGLLKHCPQALHRDVGKRGYREAFPQEKIAKLLIAAARKHRRVVRLKGGDPFIFGRGGEEAEALAKAGVPFEIVPGVSSAVAVPAYAGIPLTHRRFASSVTFLTGHEDPEKKRGGEAPPLDWAALAKQPTLVFLMGVKTLRKNFAELLKQGMNPRTPAALIEWGTYPRQRSLAGTLQSLPGLAARAEIAPPAIAVVGEVVRLRDSLAWFERRPLFGRRVLVTRGAAQASQLSRLLEERGAEVLELPTLEIRRPRSHRALDRALGRLAEYHGILFSSVHGVDFFFRRLRERRVDPRPLAGMLRAAVGPATAERLKEAGYPASKVAAIFTSAGLAKSLPKSMLRGKRWFWARAEEGEEEGLLVLRRRGAEVEIVPTYRSVAPKIPDRRLRQIFEEAPPQLLTFASGAAARHFAQRLKASRFWGRARNIPAAVIGPVTAKAAKAAGLKVAAMPPRHTIPDLVESICKFFTPL